MAVAQLGDLRWRIDPSAISWSYQIDTATIETLGGQVVQVLGATLSDMTITGYLGQDRSTKQESWQLATAFQQKIQSMMDAQLLPQSSVKVQAQKGGFGIVRATHVPVQFTYFDGKHDWSFRVLIKGIDDLDGKGQISHSSGKFSYGYKLTLFIVEADTDLLTTIAKDDFIARISNGLGWALGPYNGNVDNNQLQAFIDAHGGSATAYLTSLITGGATQ